MSARTAKTPRRAAAQTACPPEASRAGTCAGGRAARHSTRTARGRAASPARRSGPAAKRGSPSAEEPCKEAAARHVVLIHDGVDAAVDEHLPAVDRQLLQPQPLPRIDSGPRVEVSRISVSSKLSTSKTPVTERRLRESSVSRCGCSTLFASISACCMVSSFLWPGLLRLLPTYIRRKAGPMQIFLRLTPRGTWRSRRPCARLRPRRAPRP